MIAEATGYNHFFIKKHLFFSNSYLSFCFIASFSFVLQRHRAKPIPLRLRASKGSLREGAGAVGD